MQLSLLLVKAHYVEAKLQNPSVTLCDGTHGKKSHFANENYAKTCRFSPIL